MALSVSVAFRPKDSFWPGELASRRTKIVAIQTHYLYYNLVSSMERLLLYVDPDEK